MKPHWMKLPSGAKLYGTGPTKRNAPLVEIGQTADGRWIVDDGSGLREIDGGAGAGMLLDLAEFYPAGLTCHGTAKLAALKKAGQTVLRPPARREVW